MHGNLYNYELIKIQHDEARRRVTEDARWDQVKRRAGRRIRRSLRVTITQKAMARFVTA